MQRKPYRYVCPLVEMSSIQIHGQAIFRILPPGAEGRPEKARRRETLLLIELIDGTLGKTCQWTTSEGWLVSELWVTLERATDKFPDGYWEVGTKHGGKDCDGIEYNYSEHLSLGGGDGWRSPPCSEVRHEKYDQYAEAAGY
jgi:hypothetical protein